MSFLDEMSTKGIDYRKQLQKQGTEPSEKACSDGYALLDPDIPSDTDGGSVSPTWSDQVREAYLKSCLTGAPRPKPDPSGVKAVTPVPYGSTTPTAGQAFLQPPRCRTVRGDLNPIHLRDVKTPRTGPLGSLTCGTSGNARPTLVIAGRSRMGRIWAG
jgi:hypothetical protein